MAFTLASRVTANIVFLVIYICLTYQARLSCTTFPPFTCHHVHVVELNGTYSKNFSWFWKILASVWNFTQLFPSRKYSHGTIYLLPAPLLRKNDCKAFSSSFSAILAQNTVYMRWMVHWSYRNALLFGVTTHATFYPYEYRYRYRCDRGSKRYYTLFPGRVQFIGWRGDTTFYVKLLGLAFVFWRARSFKQRFECFFF